MTAALEGVSVSLRAAAKKEANKPKYFDVEFCFATGEETRTDEEQTHAGEETQRLPSRFVVTYKKKIGSKISIVGGRVYGNNGKENLTVLASPNEDEKKERVPLNSIVKHYKVGKAEPGDAWRFPVWASKK